MKTKSILYGFHDEDLESDIKRMLQTQGYQVVSVVKYGLSSIVQYASDNPIDAVIMRCKTNQELDNARGLRDLKITLILLVTAGMRGTPEMEEALKSGLNNIVFAGLRSNSRNLRSEIVNIIREERTQKEARVYYGFAPLERPEIFNGEYSMKNEQQLLMLYEYLLDRKDPRGLDVRFAKVLGMLPADERREMAETLPLPIKMLLQDSAPYKAAMIPQKKAGLFRKKSKDSDREMSSGTEIVLSGSSHMLEMINRMVEHYHEHQFDEWELIRPATEEEEGEECRRCTCGYKETRKIPKVEPQKAIKEPPSKAAVFGVGFSLGVGFLQGNVHWGPEERVEPTCETDGQIVRRGENDEGQVVDQVVGEIPALGHIPNEKTDEPDCVHSGRVISRCSRCGKVLHQKMLPPTGIHSWSDWTLESNAVCGTEGKKIRTCSVCGKTEEEVVPATDQHAFSDWTVTRAATCEESGVQVRKCTICGKEETQEIPALGHDYEKVIGKEANCSQPGYYQMKCRRCGAVQDQEEIIPATDQHVFSEWEVEKPATCVEEGKRKHTCTLCGYIKEEVIPKAEHTYQKIAAKEPTCSEDGYYNLKCSVCGHMQEQTEIIPATGKHIFADWQIIKQATCKQPGIKERFCTLCGQKETIQIPQKDHEYQKIIIRKARCQKDGVYDLKCIHCGDRKKNAGIIPGAKQHSFSQRLIKSATCTIPGLCENRCSICGITEKQEIPAAHQPRGKGIVLRQATCTEEGQVEYTCSICGEKYIATIPYAHKYGKWEVIKKGTTCADLTIRERTCSLCGKKEQDEQLSNVPHTFELFIENEVTCERDGRSIEICTTCGATKRAKKIQAMGHRYEKETVIEPTCQTTGEYRVACQNCGMVTETGSLEALGHLYGPQLAKEATCTESGKIYQLCARCQDEKLLREIPPLGHDFTEWEIVKAPDCKNAGEKIRKCRRCGFEESLPVDKLPHEWEEITMQSTCIAEGCIERTCKICGATEAVEVLPLAEHTFGKWKMAGFKDIRTCEVCGEEEQRVSYKRIILAAIGGVGIVGAAGIALLIGRNAKSADGYLETKRQQEIQALETVETTEFDKNYNLITSQENVTDPSEAQTKEEEIKRPQELQEISTSDNSTMAEEPYTMESLDTIVEKVGESSSEAEETISKNYEESTEQSSVEVPDESDFGILSDLLTSYQIRESDSLQQVLSDWNARKELLNLDTGDLGKIETYRLSQSALAEAIGNITLSWQVAPNNDSEETETLEGTLSESDYGILTNTLYPKQVAESESLRNVLSDWNARKEQLHLDTGSLGNTETYRVSQSKLAEAIGSITSSWQVVDQEENATQNQTQTEPLLDQESSTIE